VTVLGGVDVGFKETAEDLVLPRSSVALHRLDVDGLRGIAVASVILYHFNVGAFSGGFVGVDIFFVISGFVITASILADLRRDSFSILTFYFRRVRRIVPAFAALIIAVSIAAALILLPSDLADYSRSVISANFFVSNIYFWKSSGYFSAEAHTKPLLHTWSLAVEEQFYFFAPVLFLIIYRLGKHRWPTLLLPLVLASLALSIFAIWVAPTAGFFLLPTRAWELLLGAAVAFAEPPAARRLVWETAAGCGLLLLAFSIFALKSTDPFPGWNALFPCAGTALIILSGVGQGANGLPCANRLLSVGPIVWIGLISYSLYLIHWPIAAFVHYLLLKEPTLAEAASMTALSIFLAWISWQFVEQPFRRVTAKKRWVVLSAGVAVFAIGAVLGILGVLVRGLPQRFPDFVERRIPGVEDWGGEQCFNQNPANPTPWSAEACTRIHGNNGRILVWGDSFAAQYMPGILRDGQRIDSDVLQYTFAGCPPVLGYFSFARVGCSSFNKRVPDLVRSLHIDTVVMAARWTETPLRSINQLGETVARLRDAGAQVYVFGQSPEFDTDVQHVDYISGYYKRSGPAYWTISFDPKLNEHIARQSAQAHFVDPLHYLCHAGLCEYRNADEFYYADYGHFSAYGSLLAVQSYFPVSSSKSGS
jgi:peptidoglycan/LPS O-acetylase OafA/YrhL